MEDFWERLVSVGFWGLWGAGILIQILIQILILVGLGLSVWWLWNFLF